MATIVASAYVAWLVSVYAGFLIAWNLHRVPPTAYRSSCGSSSLCCQPPSSGSFRPLGEHLGAVAYGAFREVFGARLHGPAGNNAHDPAAHVRLGVRLDGHLRAGGLE